MVGWHFHESVTFDCMSSMGNKRPCCFEEVNKKLKLWINSTTLMTMVYI